MKKIIVLIALMLVPGIVLAEGAAVTAAESITATAAEPSGSTVTAAAPEQKGKTILVYDVYKHRETASNVFLAMGGVSFGIGVALATTADGNNNATQLGAGIQSVCWGAVETGLYLFDKNFGVKEYNEQKARTQFAEMSGWHAVIDIAVMFAGGCLAIFVPDEAIKGHGIGMMMQGAMLAAYDGINFFIASNPQDVKDWGAGLGYNVRFAGR